MFNLYVMYTVQPGCRESFLNEAVDSGVVAEIRRENGCRRYEYFYSAEEDTKLLLVEQWETEADQKLHMKQPHMNVLRALKEKYVTDVKVGTMQFE